MPNSNVSYIGDYVSMVANACVFKGVLLQNNNRDDMIAGVMLALFSFPDN